MNKIVIFLICFIFLLISFCPRVLAVLPTDASIIQVHDIQMINQQRFRMEELNDYNDVQTEKERYRKRTEPSSEPLVKKLFSKKKFVEQDGQIKIESDELN